MAIKNKRIKEREVKKVIALLAMAALLSGVSGAWADQKPVQSGLAKTVSFQDLDGNSVVVQQAAFKDSTGQNQYIARVAKTEPTLFTTPIRERRYNTATKRWEIMSVEKKEWRVATATIAVRDASGNGFWNNFFDRGFAGLAQGAGTMGGLGLLGALADFGTNITTNVAATGGVQTTNAAYKNFLSQNQGQQQTATGGAVNISGGVGNVKTISNDANGNGTILGGNIF